MGLAQPKKRIKLSHDPNNTKWTNDTQSFGHKIMASQGWAPGEYLGAKDAAHAEHYTAANASHIRVSIKDDNLGLGAKIGSGVGHGECVGLDAFKNILGRLNGTDEADLEREQKSRDDLKRAIYTEQRWGSVRFVSGGFLIGDKIQMLIDAETARVRKLASGSSSNSDTSECQGEGPEPIEEPKKSKKRKIEEMPDKIEVVAVKVKKSKNKSKQDRKAESTIENIENGDRSLTKLKDAMISKKSKKDKKDKKNRKSSSDADDTRNEAELKMQRHQERKEKKREKRKNVGSVEDTKKDKKKSAKHDKNKVTKQPPESPKEGTWATPIESIGRPAPVVQGRQLVRARNIAQKRMASMDPAALAQIFMIKS